MIGNKHRRYIRIVLLFDHWSSHKRVSTGPILKYNAPAEQYAHPGVTACACCEKVVTMPTYLGTEKMTVMRATLMPNR